MDSSSVHQPIGFVPNSQLVQRIAKLYDEGFYLQAYRESAPMGSLLDWRGTEYRLLAGRLAGNLGSQRLGAIFFCRPGATIGRTPKRAGSGLAICLIHAGHGRRCNS